MTTPFYNPTLSYDENYDRGPFGAFENPASWTPHTAAKDSFLGIPIDFPFGIPAGPLLNARYVSAAFSMGFPVCVYKTVRSRQTPSHPAPNVLPIDINGDLTLEKAAKPVSIKSSYSPPLSITNSFGVPSKDPGVWEVDMKEALQSARQGQLLIGSFQGTSSPDGFDAFLEDCVSTAVRVAATGVKVLELNLSCPNEGKKALLCFDIERVEAIVDAIKAQVATPLLLKLAYFSDQQQLTKFVEHIGPRVEGLCAINTIPATIVDEHGKQALPGEGRAVSGVCGDAIRWAGIEMVEQLSVLRNSLNLEFAIVGVGGVLGADHYQQYRRAGADLVLSATGAMWNPQLAQEIYKQLHN
ncbi:dihydroorotate oxidase [Candidatus Woesebacteria bacterium]|nr:dihydroorotate oxidase [Candidatus Woesebacteria bacterium]